MDLHEEFSNYCKGMQDNKYKNQMFYRLSIHIPESIIAKAFVLARVNSIPVEEVMFDLMSAVE